MHAIIVIIIWVFYIYSIEVVGRKHRLTISNVLPSVVGNVKFVASKASSEAVLTIMDPPCEFVVPLNNQTVEEKAKAVFECQVGDIVERYHKFILVAELIAVLQTAEFIAIIALRFPILLLFKVSRPNATVRWYKGRAIVRDSEKYEITENDCLRTLTIKQCTFDDEKKYTCDTDDARTTAKLTVQGRQFN